MSRRFLLVYLALTAPVLLAVWAFHRQERAQQIELLRAESNHQARLQAEVISRELAACASDLRFLTEQGDVQRFAAGAAGSREPVERELLLFCARRGLYDQIRLLDGAGREQVRIDDDGGRPAVRSRARLQDKRERYYVAPALALQRGQVYVSPLDLNVEWGRIERPHKPVIRFIAPVYDGRGKRLAFVVLNYLGSRLLGQLERLSQRFPGRVSLLDAGGCWLHGAPRPEDAWGAQLGHGRSFARRHPDLWRRLAAGGEQQFLDGAAGLVTHVPVELAPGAGRLHLVLHVPRERLLLSSRLLLRRMGAAAGLALALLLALVWRLSRAARARRADRLRLEQSEARLRGLSGRLIDAQEQERRTIARDLHDELGQLATALALDLDLAAQRASDPVQQEAIERARRAAHDLRGRARDISARLHPAVLEDLGLGEAVQSLVADLAASTEVALVADLQLDGGRLAAPVARGAYRIVQEALTNALRHARATRVVVTLHAGSGELRLAVADDGAGLDSAVVADASLGLAGMRERAELLGGRFVLDSAPGRGTRIEAALPLDRAEDRP